MFGCQAFEEFHACHEGLEDGCFSDGPVSDALDVEGLVSFGGADFVDVDVDGDSESGHWPSFLAVSRQSPQSFLPGSASLSHAAHFMVTTL